MRARCSIVSVVLWAGLGTAGCGGERAEAPPDGPPDGMTAEDPVPVAPLAPTASAPAYQGAQREFRTQTGATCRGRVAAGMGGTGFCYLGADDRVKCAGVIGGVEFGMRAADAGPVGATQIMLFFQNDGMCVARTDHTVECMGSNQNAFGDSLSTAFGRWGARDDLRAITTGTWDQLCGLTLSGQVYCGGIGAEVFGNPPIAVGAPGQTSVWVDTSGGVRLSEAGVLRPGESRTECVVRAEGLECGGSLYGPPNGAVVSGGQALAGPAETACWLDSAGSVGCTGGPLFAPGKVLHLALSYYSDSLCAIYSDGSVWCVGSNADGKLGTGSAAALAAETMVAPPGSARVRCD